jgi:hypothetical protein
MDVGIEQRVGVVKKRQAGSLKTRVDGSGCGFDAVEPAQAGEPADDGVRLERIPGEKIEIIGDSVAELEGDGGATGQIKRAEDAGAAQRVQMAR